MPRHPLGVRRDHAERYLVITTAAFALTVAGVRWYLDTAGYPTVGGGELHVAHVLWGGLALFIAVLLLLLYVGQRSLMISAVLAGVGAGLFIDEVGKFLTTSNDYFYAPAAPIIYGSILLLVLLWLVVRRRSVDRLAALRAVVEALGDGIDGRLTAPDRLRVVEQLRDAQADAAPSAEDDQLAEHLLAALDSPAMNTRLVSPGYVARGDARRLLERILPTRVERWLVVLSLIWTVFAALVAALVLLAVTQVDLAEVTDLVEDAGRLAFPTEPIWILLCLGINVVVGIAAVAALVLLRRGRRRTGLNVALVAILSGLVAGGLVTFYAAQVTALASTVLSLLQLGLILDLRIRSMRDDVEPIHVDEAAG